MQSKIVLGIGMCKLVQRNCGAAILQGVALSLLVAQTASAQGIIIDPRSIPTGSPLGDSLQSTTGVRPVDTTNTTQTTPTPAFQAGDISTSPTFNTASQSPSTTSQTPGTTADELDTSRLKPPASPSEFETYVKDATGRRIKRFGADLLVPSDRDFARPATATIPGDYPIGVGDVISVNTAGSVAGSAEFTVNPNGEIFLPRVGNVKLVGVRYRDLRSRIAQAIGLQYRGFEVSVSIKQLRGTRVYVTGFANNPGAFSLNSLSTLVNAVLAAGGPNAGGSFRTIKLYRGGREIRDFDLYELLRRGNAGGDAILQNEDVLFIPPVGLQVAVIGSVNEEAIYETKPGETLEDALRIAGGPNQLADSSRVIVYRLSDKQTVGSRELLRSDLAVAQVESGDIVQVLSQGSLSHPIERQSVVVRIEGEVQRPGNYFVSPNSPLSEVLQQAGGTSPRAFIYGTRLMRDSVKAQQRVGYQEAIEQLEDTLAAAPLTSDQTIAPADREAQLRSARQLLDRLRQKQPDGRLVLDLPVTATALPGDIILENNDRIVVPPRIDTVGVFGSVYRPASFLLNQPRPPRVRDFIDRAGGTQRQADRSNIFIVRANGEVLTRKHGALGARVQSGDVIFVPVKTQGSTFWARLRDITQIIFQLGLGAATVAAIN